MTSDQILAEHRRVFGSRIAPHRPRALPCVHEGAVLEWCKSCGGTNEARHVRDCDLHAKCTRVSLGGPVRGCDKCPDYTPDTSGV